MTTAAAHRRRSSPPSPPPAHSPPTRLPQLLEAFRPLAEHVWAEEEGTLAYQWLQSDGDPLKCLILERCVRDSGGRGLCPPLRGACVLRLA